ncbi:MAG TPA: DUF1992 domain-containing protein [Streptosporangiaceae bacterium]|nr:DUF1992 domain-containing protein [Streptosporangiaceae bacterium]
MTERKPPGMSFTSWIDQQISEAAARGAFDDLPGAGKPLPRRAGEDDDQAWLRDYLRREGIPTDALLPAPLKLRKEIAALAETVQDMASEDEVLEAVAELNYRIIEWRRIPLGPQIFVPLVDKELMLSKWRAGHPSVLVPPPAGGTRGAAADPAAADPAPARRRWWRLRGRRTPA